MDKKIAYISGPISGLQNGNSESFNKAQIELKKQGYITVNPHDICKEIYQEFSKIQNPTKEQIKELWINCMRVCMRHLTLCSCLFVLDNWESSDGARLEILTAQKLYMPVYLFKDFTEFSIDFHITKGKPIVI